MWDGNPTTVQVFDHVIKNLDGSGFSHPNFLDSSSFYHPNLFDNCVLTRFLKVLKHQFRIFFTNVITAKFK